ncbi:MAG: hypothetical protein WBH03_04930 [Cyclobacteriaceae bacterium]
MKKNLKLEDLKIKSFNTVTVSEVKVRGGERSALNPLGTFCSCDCDFT